MGDLRGRAFGIHVLLGSQTLGGAYTLARTTMGQMVIRIALAALLRGRFVLLAQPIMDLASGDIHQYELLLRMRDPLGELISPAAFLPAAERYDLIGAIDRWVVQRSIAMLADLAVVYDDPRGRTCKSF